MCYIQDVVAVIVNSKARYLGVFEDLLGENFIRFFCVDAEYLGKYGLGAAGVDDFSGLIVLGSERSVYKEHVHLHIYSEKKTIEWFIARGKPVLGVNIGAQILASVLGARVYKGDMGEEIGWFDVQITGDGAKDPVFSKYFPSIRVFQWHTDTFDLPKGAVRVATSARYLNQAFRYGDNIYGVQFHPEIKKEYIVSWCRESNLSENRAQDFLREFDLYSGDLKNLSDDLIRTLFVKRQ